MDEDVKTADIEGELESVQFWVALITTWKT